MRLKKLCFVVMTVVVAIGMMAGVGAAADFRIAIMQDNAGAARTFKPLLDYLQGEGIGASFVAAKNYSAAAEMFANGEVDAMFSGSGIAGSFIIKGVASPVVRPLSKEGTSTYWAVVLAPKGTKRFDRTAEYFRGKNVTFCGLASSGEFFFRSIPGAAQAAGNLMIAASHGAAIDVVNRGRADVAIVKNRVWDKEKDRFPNVERVGEDHGENPDGTLIASKKADAGTVQQVSAILQGIGSDNSAGAQAVKEALGIQGYIATTEDDFKHTLALLGEAGVTKDFNFSY